MTGMLQFCIWKSAMKTCELRAIKKERKKKKNCTDSGTPKRLWLRALSCSQTYDAERCHRLPLNMHADSNELNTHFDPNALNMHHQWLNGARHAHRLNGAKHVQFSSVQFSSLTDWVVGGTKGSIQQRSSSSLLCRRRPLWAVLAEAGMFTLWCCPSTISSADHSVAHPPRCPEEWFWRACDMPEPCKFPPLDRGSCGSTRKLTSLHTQSLVLCFK